LTGGGRGRGGANLKRKQRTLTKRGDARPRKWPVDRSRAKATSPSLPLSAFASKVTTPATATSCIGDVDKHPAPGTPPQRAAPLAALESVRPAKASSLLASLSLMASACKVSTPATETSKREEERMASSSETPSAKPTRPKSLMGPPKRPTPKASSALTRPPGVPCFTAPGVPTDAPPPSAKSGAQGSKQHENAPGGGGEDSSSQERVESGESQEVGKSKMRKGRMPFFEWWKDAQHSEKGGPVFGGLKRIPDALPPSQQKPEEKHEVGGVDCLQPNRGEAEKARINEAAAEKARRPEIHKLSTEKRGGLLAATGKRPRTERGAFEKVNMKVVAELKKRFASVKSPKATKTRSMKWARETNLKASVLPYEYRFGEKIAEKFLLKAKTWRAAAAVPYDAKPKALWSCMEAQLFGREEGLEEQAKRFLLWESVQYPSRVSSEGWVQVPVKGEFVLGQQVMRWVQVRKEALKKVEEKRREETMRAKLDRQIEIVKKALEKEPRCGGSRLDDLKGIYKILKRNKKEAQKKSGTLYQQSE